jgi:hypothetical protein
MPRFTARRSHLGRLLCILIAACLPAAPVFAGSTAEVVVTDRHERSLRGTIDGQAFLLLRGDHTERGKAHGYLAAREILGSINGTLSALESQRPGVWDRRFVPAMARFDFEPRYQQELAGMLEGIRAALPDPQDRVIEALGREVSLDDLKVGQCLGDLLGMGCSSFSIWGPLTADGQVMTGRNLDYWTYPVSGYDAVIAVEPDEPQLKATLDMAFFGTVGAGTSMNSDGVFVALHDGGVRTNQTEGTFTPRILAIRSALETADPENAAKYIAEQLRRTRPTMGSSLHVSAPLDPAEPGTLPAVLEWDMHEADGGVTVRAVSLDHPGGLVCTNHFAQRDGGDASDDSARRYDRLTDALEQSAQWERPVAFEDARRILDMVAKNGQTVTYISCLVWPAQRKVALGMTPDHGVSATKAPWVTFTWDDVFNAE